MKVIIAGSDSKINYAISILVQEQPGWMVAAMVNRASELSDTLEQVRPDLLILDQELSLHDLEGNTQLLHDCPYIILLVSTPIHRTYPIDLDHERHIPVSKLESPEMLLDIFRRIQAGEGQSPRRV
jgi:DNA-binding NarL/FixJ family response regulator